jgi:hypothetical protein
VGLPRNGDDRKTQEDRCRRGVAETQKARCAPIRSEEPGESDESERVGHVGG